MPRVGDQPPQPPAGDQPPVRIIAWRPSGTTESTNLADLAPMCIDLDARIWVDLLDPPPDRVREIDAALGLHPLIAENIIERNQRAKIETFDDVVHIVMFALTHAGEVAAAEIDFVLSKRYLVSVHGPEWNPAALPTLRAGVNGVLARGTDHLLYVLTDAIVDGYFPVLDWLAEEIDQLQDQIVQTASQWTLERLFALKRELIEIRRATSPAREIFNQLTNRDVPAIDEEDIVYFRDVYDHLLRVTDELDNYRELVAGSLDIYLTIVNNNLSMIMKRLTGVTVIVAGIGAIAGIFGMSEAATALAGQSGSGFWIVTSATIVLAAIAAVILRRIDWI